MISLTWVSTEKLFPNVTPRNENSSTRAMPGIGGGGTAFLLLGLLNTISTDFALLSLRLFTSAQVLMLSNSSNLVSTCSSATMRSVSSAYLTRSFSGLTVRRSDALMTYDAGPITLPWMMLARMCATSDTKSLCAVQCERPSKKSTSQL